MMSKLAVTYLVSVMIYACVADASDRVALIVNHELASSVQTELMRMKIDMEAEGYEVVIVPWEPNSGSGKALWWRLRDLYHEPASLKGAVLIGKVPLVNTRLGDMNRGTYFRDTAFSQLDMFYPRELYSGKEIWISRYWVHDLVKDANQDGVPEYDNVGLIASGMMGPQQVLVKRALDANHAYRRGHSRMTHNACMEISNDFSSYGEALFPFMDRYWDTVEYDKSSVEPPRMTGMTDGKEYTQGKGHGMSFQFHAYEIDTIMNEVVQTRYSSHSMTWGCAAYFGLESLFLYTRGGGNVLNMPEGSFSMDDEIICGYLHSGRSWGDTLVAYGFNGGEIAYGDLSLGVKLYPANRLPVVDTFHASVLSGSAPLTVGFTASGSDPDGSVNRCEWFPRGRGYSRISPEVTAGAGGGIYYTYRVPHRYMARVEVVDDFMARNWQAKEIRVAPQQGVPLRINAGLYSGFYIIGSPNINYAHTFDYLDGSGKLWLHDQEYADGTWGFIDGAIGVVSPSGILGTTDDLLFQNLRIGGDTTNEPVTYSIPLANGTYTLRLGFAETMNAATNVRVFDVVSEGETVVSRLDVYKEAGARYASLVKTVSVDVADGVLNLKAVVSTPPGTGTGSSGAPFFGSIEIIPQGYTNRQPVASLVANVTSGPAPLAVMFTGGGSDPDGDTLSYEWDFGDAETSELQSPEHRYSNAGTYQAQLTVFDGKDLYARTNITITVLPSNQNPSAEIGVNTNRGIAPLTVVLTGGGIDPESGDLTYLWLFGDDQYSTNQNTTHTFSAPGNYTVRLLTMDDAAGVGCVTQTVTVTAPAGNVAPIVVAGADGSTTKGGVFYFTSSASDPNGDVMTQTWTFVSGPYEALISGSPAVSTNPYNAYAYSINSTGTYLFSYTASDGALSSSATVSVVVDNAGPQSSFTATPITGSAPLMVSFTNTSTDADGDALTYEWIFEGGFGYSTATNIDYLFAQGVATNKIRMRATDSHGAAGSWHSMYITVADAPGNEAPVVDAGTNQALTLPAMAFLRGTVIDPDANSLTTRWIRVSGPTTVLFADDAALFTSAEFGATGTYVLALSAYDGAISVTDTVMVVVAGMDTNYPPVINGVSPVGEVSVALHGSQPFIVTASDPDADALTYEWFLNDAVLPGTSSNILYTPEASQIGTNLLRVVVGDGVSGFVVNDWVVTVTGSNVAPVITNAVPGNPVYMSVGATQMFAIAGRDVDGDTLSYRWFLDGIQAGTDVGYTYVPGTSDAGLHRVVGLLMDGVGGVATSSWVVAVTPIGVVPGSVTLGGDDCIDFGGEIGGGFPHLGTVPCSGGDGGRNTPYEYLFQGSLNCGGFRLYTSYDDATTTTEGRSGTSFLLNMGGHSITGQSGVVSLSTRSETAFTGCGSITLANVGDVTMGAIDMRATEANAEAGDLRIGSASQPAGLVRVDSICANNDALTFGPGSVEIYGNGDVLIATAGGIAGDILTSTHLESQNHPNTHWNNVVIRHQGRLVAGNIQTWYQGDGTGPGLYQTAGNVLLDGGNRLGSAVIGDVSTFMAASNYTKYVQGAGNVTIQNYAAVTLGAVDTHYSVALGAATNSGITEGAGDLIIQGIAGGVSVVGAIDLASSATNALTDSGVVSIECGGITEVAGLNLSRIKYAVFNANGYSLVNGTLIGVDGLAASGLGNIGANLRTPAGKTVFYSVASNSALNGLTYTLADGAGTPGAGGWLKPSSEIPSPWITDASPESPFTMKASSSTVFAVTAVSTNVLPLMYMWYVDGGVLASETNASYHYLTDMEDIGLHELRVVVADGAGSATNNWSVTVVDPASNALPVIVSANPASPFNMLMNTSQVFSVSASDADGDGLSYVWRVDGGVKAGATNASFTYSPTVSDLGIRMINVVVGDGRGGYATNVWAVTVLDKMPLFVARSGAGGAYTSIVAAIAAAVAGDTIRIIESPHTENNITVNKSVKIEGLGATNTIVQAAGARRTAGSRIFTLAANTTVVFRDMTLKHGDAANSTGGAIQLGGAIAGVTVTVQRCSLEDNDAYGSAANQGSGGAMHFGNSGLPTVTVIDSTFSGNVASNSGSSGAGGAINCQSGFPMIRNCTFSGNRAYTYSSGTYGGAIRHTATSGGTSLVQNCTFVDNAMVYLPGASTTVGGGAIGGGAAAAIQMESCALAANTGSLASATTCRLVSYTNCVYDGTISGTSQGGNISTNAPGVNAVLTYNGGQTRTHALLTNSPAIDKGSNPAGLSYDQRGVGYSRTVGGATDAGAYEYGAGAVVVPSGTLIIVR